MKFISRIVAVWIIAMAILFIVAALVHGETCVPCASYVYVHNPKRSMSARHRFEVQTGFDSGRKGWIVDHVVPLCAGGADDPSNMQWQTVDDAKDKDRVEKAICACLRAQAKRAWQQQKTSH